MAQALLTNPCEAFRVVMLTFPETLQRVRLGLPYQETPVMREASFRNMYSTTYCTLLIPLGLEGFFPLKIFIKRPFH